MSKFSQLLRPTIRVIFQNSVTYVTGPAKTGHVGTKYTLLLNESHLVTGTEYFHSVTSSYYKAR